MGQRIVYGPREMPCVELLLESWFPAKLRMSVVSEDGIWQHTVTWRWDGQTYVDTFPDALVRRGATTSTSQHAVS